MRCKAGLDGHVAVARDRRAIYQPPLKSAIAISPSHQGGCRRTRVEFSIRHVSNAGLKKPNRGEDFLTLAYVF
jgi:hypothetical protein